MTFFWVCAGISLVIIAAGIADYLDAKGNKD
jgi:hypothetical protein